MKMTNEKMNEIVKALNDIPWRTAPFITPEANLLVQEHISKMKRVISYLFDAKGLDPIDAYANAQSAGFDASDYNSFMNLLFDDVAFANAQLREPLILTICSYYFWEDDRDVGHLENPWTPLMKLYEMGYVSTFDEHEEQQTLDVIIKYRDGKQSYPLWQTEDDKRA